MFVKLILGRQLGAWQQLHQPNIWLPTIPGNVYKRLATMETI
jgi:hypothetical protein